MESKTCQLGRQVHILWKRLFQRRSHLAIDYDSNTVRRIFKWIAVIQCKIGVFANFERANAILNA